MQPFETWHQSSWFMLFSTQYLVQTLTHTGLSVNDSWGKWPKYQLTGNSLPFDLRAGFVKGRDATHTLIMHTSNILVSIYCVHHCAKHFTYTISFSPTLLMRKGGLRDAEHLAQSPSAMKRQSWRQNWTPVGDELLSGVMGKPGSTGKCTFGFSPPPPRCSQILGRVNITFHTGGLCTLSVRVNTRENLKEYQVQYCCLTDAKMEAQQGCLTCLR